MSPHQRKPPENLARIASMNGGRAEVALLKRMSQLAAVIGRRGGRQSR